MTRLVGYAWEVTPGTGTAADAAQLTLAGAERIFTDVAAAGAKERPGLRDCLDFVETGDMIIVTSASMLAPTAAQFLAAVTGLVGRGVGFRSLSEPALSTGTDMDPADVFVALESLRRRLSSLQTRAGMAAAASKGRRPGRPTVMTPERVAMAVELRDLGRPVTHIARVLGVSANAVQRALASKADHSSS